MNDKALAWILAAIGIALMLFLLGVYMGIRDVQANCDEMGMFVGLEGGYACQKMQRVEMRVNDDTQ